MRFVLPLLLLVGCKSASRPQAEPAAKEPIPLAPMPVNEAGSVTISAVASEDVLEDGSRVVTYETVFLADRLKNASGPLILWLEDIEAENGSSALFYLGKPEGFDEADYLGSFATIGGMPTHFRRHSLEVNDSDGGAGQITSLSTLRSLASFSVVMVVRDGSVTVDRITLFAKEP